MVSAEDLVAIFSVFVFVRVHRVRGGAFCLCSSESRARLVRRIFHFNVLDTEIYEFNLVNEYDYGVS